MKTIQYQPKIDGLRAIAVLSDKKRGIFNFKNLYVFHLSKEISIKRYSQQQYRAFVDQIVMECIAQSEIERDEK